MYPSGLERARYVQQMFARISLRYDLMNRLITAGQDVFWRQEVVQRLNLPQNSWLIDLGAGTGDLAKEAYRKHPDWHCVAVDFTLEMMQAGRKINDGAGLDWLGSDALCLPFTAETFLAAVSGFLMRNVSDIDQALREQYRILKPGGKIIILDTTRPAENLFRPLINFHLHRMIPLIGALISGEKEAYTYLPVSTEHFLSAEQMAARLVMAGFHDVGFHRLMFGTVAIHWGLK